MANPAVISWAKYGWETAYGTATTTLDKQFGHGVRITTLSRRNNLEKVFGLGNRNAQKLIPKKYEGAKTVEFILASPWFLRAVFGTCSVAGAGPYTHTFTEANTIPSMTIENDVQTDTASVAKLSGCQVATCVISAAVGELVRVRLDMVYANEIHGTSTSAQVSEAFDLFTFANGTLELPDGTTLAEVQNVELTMNNNNEPTFGLGSRFSQKGPVKNREYTARATLAFEASGNLLEKLYGGTTGPVVAPAETATMQLVFDNGLTGTNQRQIQLTFQGIQLDEHNLPQDPTALIVEDATLVLRTCSSCTAINNTSTAP